VNNGLHICNCQTQMDKIVVSDRHQFFGGRRVLHIIGCFSVFTSYIYLYPFWSPPSASFCPNF